MKIFDFIVEDNYEEKAAKALNRLENASAKLTEYERLININKRALGIEYYDAYLEYLSADRELMVSFLNYIKVCYEEFEKGKFMLTSSKWPEIDALKDKTEVCFSNYYEKCETLTRIEESLRNEIDKSRGFDLTKHPLKLIRLHGFLIGIDNMHASVANSAEEYRNKEIMPLLESCEDLFFTKIESKPVDDEFLS